MSDKDYAKSVLIVSDNEQIITELILFFRTKKTAIKSKFTFVSYENNMALVGKTIHGHKIGPINMKKDYKTLLGRYDMIISAHSKQIFPEDLVKSITCINIHPGYNPYNRGWYPQVFSILNNKKLGATIHLIDDKLDHGAIIAQKEVKVNSYDTSKTAYDKVLIAEMELVREYLQKILKNNYFAKQPNKEGNINLKRDFEKLREINLDQNVTYREAIDRLRALSHPPYKNAYFFDENGKKIYISVELEEEANELQ